MLKREYIYIPFVLLYLYNKKGGTKTIFILFLQQCDRKYIISTAVSGMFAQIGVVLNRTTTVDSGVSN